MALEPRTTRHSAPAAVAKQRYSTNPERVPACNRRRSNSCKPSASFLPASVGAKRHLFNTRPSTPVADFAPRGRAAADRIMSACQRPRVLDVMMATPTAPSSRKSPRLPLASRKKPRRQDGIMTSAATWRIWSDVGIHWCENNWAGAKTASIVCCSTRRSTQRSRTHGAKMSGCGGYDGVEVDFCVTDYGVHSLQLEEARSAVVSISSPRLWKVLVSFNSG